jgi:hypothetical protein
MTHNKKRFRNLFDEEDSGARRVLKGGSFVDTRDGDESKDSLKIRISSRVGKHTNYTAVNVGFRCAQTIEEDDDVEFNDKGFNIVRLRAPIHHGKRPVKVEEEPLMHEGKRVVLKRRIIVDDL